MRKNQQWKDKVQELLQVCQNEFMKTTKIGKKMLSASKTNTNLHEAYEEIGRLAVKAMKKKDLKWENSRVSELLAIVKTCESELKSIESDVNKIKFAPGPIDVSVEIKAEDEKKEDKLGAEELIQNDEKKN
ncbi:MAG: hypothetical protein HN576_07320 [Bacteriovoracaceae bacterium]|nr:hypothetical protein [Bacteriovoracaceae bacterium]